MRLAILETDGDWREVFGDDWEECKYQVIQWDQHDRCVRLQFSKVDVETMRKCGGMDLDERHFRD